MALTIRQSSQFRRDVKRLQRQNQELSKLEAVVETLIAEETLEDRYKDHTLIGNWQGYRECHIQPRTIRRSFEPGTRTMCRRRTAGSSSSGRRA